MKDRLTVGIEQRFQKMKPFLNEHQIRLLAACEANALGYGGVSIVARLTGLSRVTISLGQRELTEEIPERSRERIRRVGGGRKKVVFYDKSLKKDLEKLIDPYTRGDPESPLKWTAKSVRNLATELRKQGHPTSHRMVAELLHEMDYSLQANKKTLEGGMHPDRNAQFEYISKKVKEYQEISQPVISVDTKKKELVGNFKNGGRELRPQHSPERVNVYDFKIPELGKVAPYGVYDISKNVGWVNVGVDHDTAQFAVQSIRTWWISMGSQYYPNASQLLITADGGGSNGVRVRLWKTELQKLANETGLTIVICHFPSGTSKWNKIEHRLFSFISQNWRGKPLTSHQVIVDMIAATKTKTGLKVSCTLDQNKYPKGIKISNEEINKINLMRHEFHGDWNYTIIPQ
jgi:transposase